MFIYGFVYKRWTYTRMYTKMKYYIKEKYECMEFINKI